MEQGRGCPYTFHNPNPLVLAGDLDFPLPEGATVSGYGLDVGGRPADLVAVTMQNPQMNQQQFVAYNFFLTGANVWIQVMGPAQAQVQQAANLVLQGMQTRQ